MSNLVPEKRVNKNGVLVTKHVKPAGAPSASKSAIPAPSLSGPGTKASKGAQVTEAPSSEEIIQQLNKRNRELHGENNKSMERGYAHELSYVEKYPADLRQKMYDFFGSASQEDFVAMHNLLQYNYMEPNRFSGYLNTIDGIRRIDSCVGFKDTSQCADNFENVYESLELNEVTENIGDYEFGLIKAEHLARKLRLTTSYYKPKHKYYAEVDNMRNNIDSLSSALPVVVAAKKARDKVFAEKVNDPHLTDEERKYVPITSSAMVEIAEWANQYPDKIDQIADIIDQRGDFDPDLIENMLNSDSSAVSSGML